MARRGAGTRAIVGCLATTLMLAGTELAAASERATTGRQDAAQSAFVAGADLGRPPLTTDVEITQSATQWTGQPIVVGETLHVVARNGFTTQVQSRDLATGELRWARDLAAFAQLTYDDGRLYALDARGTLIALRHATGALLWTRQLPEPFDTNARPTAVDGSVYAATAWSGGSVYAIDGDDGDIRWSQPQSHQSTPAVTEQLVLDTGGCYTQAWTKNDGRRAWARGYDCTSYDGSVATNGAHVVSNSFSFSSGKIADLADGRLIDTAGIGGLPAVAGDTLVVRDGTTLRARSLATGLSRWAVDFRNPVASDPVVVDAVAYAVAGNGVLIGVDLATGAEVMRRAVPGIVDPTHQVDLAVGSGRLVVRAATHISILTAADSGPTRPGAGLAFTSGPSGPIRVAAATFAFTGSTGLSTECRTDAGPWVPCIGATTTLALADGPHTVEVRAKDADGTVQAQAARGFTVDRTAPTARITSGPSATVNWTSVSFTLASDGDAVAFECRMDDEEFAACPTSSGGPTYSALPEGPHRFQVRATDLSGNVQNPPTTRTFVIDRTAPQPTYSERPVPRTRERTARFAWTLDEPSTATTCYLPEETISPCTSPVVREVGARTNQFTLSVRDATGNSAQHRVSWVVDDIPPETTISQKPVDATTATDARFAFFATGESSSTDNPVTFQCAFDDEGYSACASPTTYSGIGPGTHTFRVRAIDGLGNTDATPATHTWTIDSGEPATVTITEPPLTPTNRTVASLGFATTGAARGVDCALDDAPPTPCTSPVTFSDLEEGSHTVDVVAIAANGDRSGAEVSFVVDTRAPTTDFATSVLPGAASQTVTLDSDDPAATFECRVDSRPWRTCMNPWSTGPQPPGRHELAARAIDAAGNVDATPATQTWTATAVSVASQPPAPSPSPTTTAQDGLPDAPRTPRALASSLATQLRLAGTARLARTTIIPVTYATSGPGTLRVEITRKVRGRTVRLARGERRARRASAVRLSLRTTNAGRSLRGSATLRLGVRFTPTRGRPSTAARTVTVRRQGSPRG